MSKNVEVFKDYREIRLDRASTVCLGNFDGLHLGHQEILLTCLSAAKQQGNLSVAFTFNPHPLKVLRPGLAPALLFSTEERRECLEKIGFDKILEQGFDSHFAQLSPKDFIESVLIRALRTTLVIVGPNFRFGFKAEGNIELLRKYSSEFEVQEVSALEKDGRIISSSWIRELVKAGNVTKAGELLGRLYFASGEVVAGDARGRELRVPTANLKTARECLPLPGVYVSVFEDLLTGHAFASVTNLGFRPTFGEGGLKLETHLLNFRDDLYGRKSRVFFLERIREERKFSDVSSLRSQLVLDLTNASKYFQRHKLMRLDPEKSSLTLGRVDPLTQNFQSALFLKGL